MNCDNCGVLSTISLPIHCCSLKPSSKYKKPGTNTNLYCYECGLELLNEMTIQGKKHFESMIKFDKRTKMPKPVCPSFDYCPCDRCDNDAIGKFWYFNPLECGVKLLIDFCAKCAEQYKDSILQ